MTPESFQDRLKIILKNIDGDYDGAPTENGLKKATRAILELLKESLPNRRDDKECYCEPQEGCGCSVRNFNEYRTELLKRWGMG